MVHVPYSVYDLSQFTTRYEPNNLVMKIENMFDVFTPLYVTLFPQWNNCTYQTDSVAEKFNNGLHGVYSLIMTLSVVETSSC